MRLEELIERVPVDSEDRVRKSISRTREKIREVIRKETALRLSFEEVGSVNVPIRLKAGLPLVLCGKEIPQDRTLAALLAPFRGTLQYLHASSDTTMKLVVPILKADGYGLEVLQEGEGGLSESRRLAEALLKLITTFDLVEWILEVNEDVLGAYFSTNSASHIELYWGVIALVASALPADVEDLTLVVLAHELAHAYSHVGADIEGHRWDTGEFHAADSALKEGLAQYYTVQVCRALRFTSPGPLKAYQSLLPKQPAKYHAHRSWLRAHRQEEVRSAMLETRRRGPGTLKGFERSLVQEGQRLGRKSNQATLFDPSEED